MQRGSTALERRVQQIVAGSRTWIGTAVVELVGISDGVASLRIIPNPCTSHHPSYDVPADMVLAVLEERIREGVPEIRRVVAVQ